MAPADEVGTIRSAFCYGTLMAPQVLYRVIFGSPRPEPWQARRIAMRPAILHHFRRQRVKWADFPAIVPNPASNVRGAFITGLTDMDIFRLDSFEGGMYARQRVKVKLLKNVGLEDTVSDSSLARLEGEEAEAETYVWTNSLEDLEDMEWDFRHFKEQRMRVWMGDMIDSDTEVDQGFADADAVGITQAIANTDHGIDTSDGTTNESSAILANTQRMRPRDHER